jgi:voltage-gated potassium channel
MSGEPNGQVRKEVLKQREGLLHQVQEAVELPLLVLSGAWLALLIWEFVGTSRPALTVAQRFIWGVFILEFLLELVLAPRKLQFLRSNLLGLLALILPALRILRTFRVVRFWRAASPLRGIRLLRLVTSLNRGVGALRASMGRRAFGYVLASSLAVLFTGAAGMYAFEKDVSGGLPSYSAALWWTAMLLSSIGTEYWPKTGEGQVLCLLLALYGLGIFGYVAASLAAFFVGRDAADLDAEVAGAEELKALRSEIRELRSFLGTERDATGRGPPPTLP